ncbi:MAG TPA: PH domain-containing protein [Phycisphaerales bacterium]|nr:PH domain-containing protein [Phycisphaerales bacterium]HMP37644.1 PH domain-containing protein [Phycisphaerales bacterium]
MALRISCDRCDRLFEVDEEHAGGRAACPWCGDVNRVPVHAPTPGAPLPKGRAPSPPGAGGVPGIPGSPGPLAAPTREAAAAGATAAGEEVVAVVRQAMFRAHPFLYAAFVLLILGGAVGAGLAGASVVAIWLAPVGLAAMAIGSLALVGWWLAPHRWTKLVITTRRTIRQEGIVMRKTSEVLHHHVTNVVIEQSLFQRLLGVGYIGIDTAGQGAGTGASAASHIEIEVWNIPKPYEVKATIDRYRLGHK